MGRSSRFEIAQFTLPTTPSSNHCYGINIRARHGRRMYLTKDAKDYKTLIEEKVKESLVVDRESLPALMVGDWIVVELYHFDKKVKHIADTSNRHKLIGDGIKEGLGIDDAFFLIRDMSREYESAISRICVVLVLESRRNLDIRREGVSG